MKPLRVATRQSPLALWQAESVKKTLEKYHPDLKIEIVGMTTQGDKHLELPFAAVSGKSLFVKELENALIENRADIAVHSIKDMPIELPKGLILAVIGQREDPRDVFVSNDYAALDALPHAAVVGTASLRRYAQLKAMRPDLEIKTLRGNVETRLKRLGEGNYAAIILAAAGLLRLNLSKHIRHYFEPTQMLPAPGQGALGIECRQGDQEILSLIEPLKDKVSQEAVFSERAMSRVLGGGCRVPLGAYATVNREELLLRGLVSEIDGSKVLRGEIKGHRENAEQLGEQLGKDLLAQGARDILEKYGN